MPITESVAEHTERPYPHPGGCEGCFEARVCNFCRKSLSTDWSACTNGRCGDCHRAQCTAGGVTGPGHGYGPNTPARFDGSQGPMIVGRRPSVNPERDAIDVAAQLDSMAVEIRDRTWGGTDGFAWLRVLHRAAQLLRTSEGR